MDRISDSMDKINRAVVKAQAKDIIKGKVFYLFLITFIVSLLTGSGFSTSFNFNVNDNNFELFRPNNNQSQEDTFPDSFWDYNPIEDFEFNGVESAPEVTELSVSSNHIPMRARIGSVSGVSFIAGIIFMPLLVTLSGMYLSLVRRNPLEPFNLGNELGGIFKNSFDETYLKKLVVELLRDVIMVLLMLLLIVPGVIFYYSSYFTEQIMSDNPNLKPSEAIKLSKKMIKGNRGELFVLDLSFIPMILLCVITLGIASIYVIPYMNTVKALYYENFRMRALQYGRITNNDFMSAEEKYNAYNQNMNNGFNQDSYSGVNQNSNNYYGYTDNTSNTQGYYYSPQTEAQPTEPENNVPPQNNYYYNPPTDNDNIE